jgi:hypothetical protein
VCGFLLEKRGSKSCSLGRLGRADGAARVAPVGGTLQQSDATGWMAFYALCMAAIATLLNRSGKRPCADLILKFLEHFAGIREAMDAQQLWDEEDGLAYDRLVANGTSISVKVRSMVGVIPLLAAVVLDESLIERVPSDGFDRHCRRHDPPPTWRDRQPG